MWIFLVAMLLISAWLMSGRMEGERWRYTVYMDGSGYYAQLPAFFIYDDPSCSFYATQSAIAPDSPVFLREVNGKPVNKYFCGEAVLQLPFFTAAHLIAKSSGYAANGYSQPYFYSVAFAAIFYFLLGLFFLWKLLEKFGFRKCVILFTCFCFAAGTNLFHYTVYEPSMSHVYSFAAVTGFFYFMRCFFIAPSRKYILLSALALGFVTLLRPVNLAVLLAFPLMAGEWSNVKAAFRWMRENIFSTIATVVVFLATGFIQLYFYHWQTGKFFVWSYTDEGFDFFHTHFTGTLFGFEKGLFIYTPLIFIAMIGLVVMMRRSRYLFLSFLPVFFVLAWIIAAWHEWRYGYSFGLRVYIDHYGLFALPFAFLVDAAFAKKIFRAPFIAVCLLLVALYGVQQYQYLERIIHPGGMDRQTYWLTFLKTDKKYQDTVTYILLAREHEEYFNDMEGAVNWPGSETITDTFAHSGAHSSRIDSAAKYSCSFGQTMSDKLIFNHPNRLVISAFVLRNNVQDSCRLGIAQVKNEQVFFLQDFPLPPIKKAGEWQKIRQEVKIPETVADGEMLKVFFVHQDGVVYIDDFKVEIKGR